MTMRWLRMMLLMTVLTAVQGLFFMLYLTFSSTRNLAAAEQEKRTGISSATVHKVLTRQPNATYVSLRYFSCPTNIASIPYISGSVAHAPTYRTYARALHARASAQRIIVLLVVDRGYLDMAMNLYRSSLQRFNITNYLFWCLDHQSYTSLIEAGVACHFNVTSGYNSEDDTKIAADSTEGNTLFGSEQFRVKTHIKTRIVLEALLLGYTAVIVDVDIIFFKNPLPTMTCHNCDIMIQTDGDYAYNSGFYIVWPTVGGITLHRRALEMGYTHNITNQKALGIVLRDMMHLNQIALRVLSAYMYLNGMVYFEKMRHTFPIACGTCIILHNNWVVGKAAKVHRFRSHLLWFLDEDGYYTNPQRKYLVYGNPFDFKNDTPKYEMQAFKNALFLGHLLNRVVIIPKWHCHGCGRYVMCNANECPMQTFISIAELERGFKGAYREHSFLCHPWVPSKVKQDSNYSLQLRIFHSRAGIAERPPDKSVINLIPADLQAGPRAQEIISWFNRAVLRRKSVLRIHNLYGTFANLYKDKRYSEFVDTLNNYVVSSDYRQYTSGK